MKPNRYQFPLIVVLALIISFGLIAYISANNQGLAIGGAIEAPTQTLAPENLPLVNSPEVVEWALVDVDTSLLNQDIIEITLPFSNEPRAFKLVKERREEMGNGDVAWYGKIAGDDLSTVVMVQHQTDIALSIRPFGGNEYHIYPYSNGNEIATAVDPQKLPALGDDAIDPETEETIGSTQNVSSGNSDASDTIGSTGATNSDTTESTAGEDTITIQPIERPSFVSGKLIQPQKTEYATFQSAPTIIDILIAYTPAARAYGSWTQQQVDTIVALNVAVMNNALYLSQTNTQFRLVFVYQTNYTESPKMYNNLNRFRKPYDGYMDEAHVYRDQYGADIMALFTYSPSNDWGGMAYVPSAEKLQSGSTVPFGVSATDRLTNSSIFAHEVGHNLGMEHGTITVGGAIGAHTGGTVTHTGMFPYSRGYYAPDNSFYTIMSYGCLTVWCPQIMQYSNPSVPYQGQPSGDATHNNARTLRTYLNGKTVAEWIADYRDAETPYTPTNVSATDGAHFNRTTITWDAAEGASTYSVLRRDNQTNANNVIGTTNQTTFDDTTGVPEQHYDYYVRAENGSISSALSLRDSGYSITANSIPSSPQNIQQSGQPTTTSLKFAWTPSQHPEVTGYTIFSDNECEDELETVGLVTNYTMQNLSPGMSYRISMKTVTPTATSYCEESYSLATRPLAVTNLQATQGSSPLVLTWDRSQTMVPYYVGYDIYRSTSPNVSITPENLIHHVNPVSHTNPLTYQDTSAVAGTIYYYRVVATAIAGTEPIVSDPSAEAIGFIGVNGSFPPTSLQMTNITDTTADLSWAPSPSFGVTGYEIFLSDNFNYCTTLFKTVGNVTNDTVTNLIPAHTYYFSMRAISGTVPGPCSSPLKMLKTPPSTVTNVYTTPAANDISLTWTPSYTYSNFMHNVYRSTTPGFTIGSANRIFHGAANSPALVVQNGTITYVDTSAQPGVTYYYHATTSFGPFGNYAGPESAPGPEATGVYP